MNRLELMAILGSLSEDLEASGVEGAREGIVVVGGAALLLQRHTSRQITEDIDALAATPNTRRLADTYPEINFDVAAHADYLPYNYEDRLTVTEVLSGALQVITPSLEDLVVMKLYAGRPKDTDDLHSRELLEGLDWSLLDELVLSPDEARASVLADESYRRLIWTYQEYRDEYGPEGEPDLGWPYPRRGTGR